VITVGNALGIIIGVVAIVLGLILLVTWWAMFVKALMALVPILLVVIGAGILIYFISETKSKLEMKKEETAPVGEKKAE
jgi:threonine/homoserine/homoserine lactone efflux protein